MVADLISRIIIAPEELPIGVIAAFIGAPFFLYLIRKGQRRQKVKEADYEFTGKKSGLSDRWKKHSGTNLPGSKDGEFVGLIGPNGCGKSTLLKKYLPLLQARPRYYILE